MTGTLSKEPPESSDPTDTEPPRSPAALGATRSRTPSVLLAVALIVAVAVPLAISLWTDGLDLPHNDGWAYSRIAEIWARTGHIQLVGWGRMSLFGQFLVLGPLARWIAAQQLYVLMLAGALLIATYDVLRAAVGPRRAAFGVLCLALLPGLGLVSLSFMADVPAFAARMVCLAIGRRALSSGRPVLLVLSVLVGLWATTIREQSLAAPAAVLVVAAYLALRRRTFRWSLVIGSGVALLVAFGLFELWRRSYSNDDPGLAGQKNNLVAVRAVLVQGYFFLALALLPAVLLVCRPWRWRPLSFVGAGLAAALAWYGLHIYHARGFILGNYLTPDGPYTAVGAQRSINLNFGHGYPAPIFTPHIWWLVVGAACVGGVLLAGELVRGLGHLDPLLATFLVFMVVGTTFVGAQGDLPFDRYWWPVLPVLLAAVLSNRVIAEHERAERRVNLVLAAAGCAGLLTLSLITTSAGMSYDHVRWHTAQQLVDRGVPAVQVDAGLDWDGYHAPYGMRPAHSRQFPGTISCYLIDASHAVGPTPLYRVSYQPFLVGPQRHMWVYYTGRAGCVPPAQLRAR